MPTGTPALGMWKEKDAGLGTVNGSTATAKISK